MHPKILLTGSTGFVGQNLLQGWLKKPHPEIWLLIRPQEKKSADERFQEIKNTLVQDQGLSKAELEERLHLVQGDIEAPNLALSQKDFKSLARSINRITHSAASVHLDLNENQSRRMNLEGTQNVLQLAELALDLGGLERFNYLSTAYVAGKRKGIIYEEDLDKGQGFTNTYEKTKLAAEKEVHFHMDRFPATVFRPSIIVGDSKTGRIQNFNVIYAPLKLTYYGKLKYLPGNKHTKLDIVPIDYVTNALLHLESLGDEVIGKTFHLVVGQGRAISMRDFIDQCAEHFIYYIDHYGLKNPKRVPKMIHPRLFDFLAKAIILFSQTNYKRAYQRFQTFAPYLFYHKEFNDDEATKLLKPAGIVAPKVSEYLSTLCKYCVDTHFGASKGPRDVV